MTLDVINEERYVCGVLGSFGDKDTERVWLRERSRRLDPATQRAALRKLLILDAAEDLDDLRDTERRTMAAEMPPIHPGEILAEEYLAPFGVTQHKVAVDIGVPPRRINEIVHGKRRITADTALRLARYFMTSDRFWLNLQNRYDLEVERDRLTPVLDRIEPLPAAVRNP